MFHSFSSKYYYLAGSSAELVAKPTKIKKLSESRKSTASKAVEPETVEVVDKVEVKQTVPLVSPDLLEGLVAYVSSRYNFCFLP